MQDPNIYDGEGSNPGINVPVVAVSFATTGQRRALAMQMAQALPVLAIDDPRAEGGPAACTKLFSQYMKSDSLLVRTKATPVEEVE
jgi:hypothetical protein